MKPCLGKPPVTFDCRGRDTHNVCCLFDGEATEVAQLNHACFLRVERCQGFERVVERDEFGAAFDGAIYIFIQGEFLKILTALFRIVFTRVIYEQATHDLCGHSEKMGPVLPIYSRLIYET